MMAQPVDDAAATARCHWADADLRAAVQVVGDREAPEDLERAVHPVAQVEDRLRKQVGAGRLGVGTGTPRPGALSCWGRPHLGYALSRVERNEQRVVSWHTGASDTPQRTSLLDRSRRSGPCPAAKWENRSFDSFAGFSLPEGARCRARLRHPAIRCASTSITSLSGNYSLVAGRWLVSPP